LIDFVISDSVRLMSRRVSWPYWSGNMKKAWGRLVKHSCMVLPDVIYTRSQRQCRE